VEPFLDGFRVRFSDPVDVVDVVDAVGLFERIIESSWAEEVVSEDTCVTSEEEDSIALAEIM